MIYRFWTLVTCALLYAGVCAPLLHAQSAVPVGEIARIAEKPRTPIAQTTLAELWRARGQPLRKRAALVEQDRLELKGDVWIDLHLRRDALDARVVLAPLDRQGLYRIEASSVTRVGGLRLAVERGAMLIELLQGELEALAADVSMIVHGTTVLLEVDATGAYCFLQEGHVSFPGYEIGFAGENQLWRLQSGERPELVTLDPSQLAVWQAHVRSTALAVRPVALWKKPAFLIGTAAVVGAAAYLLTRGSDTASGTVTLPIPD